MILKSVDSLYDLKICADIWLTSSITAHNFIPYEFWQNNYNAMLEQYLPASNVYLLVKNQEPIAFAATYENTLAAIFVLPQYSRQGAGSHLLSYLFNLHNQLTLTVYKQNKTAINFYQNKGFSIQGEQNCPHTNQQELCMRWTRSL